MINIYEPNIKKYSEKTVRNEKTLAKWEGSIPLGCLKAASAFANHLVRKNRLVRAKPMS